MTHPHALCLPRALRANCGSGARPPTSNAELSPSPLEKLRVRKLLPPCHERPVVPVDIPGLSTRFTLGKTLSVPSHSSNPRDGAESSTSNPQDPSEIPMTAETK